LVPLAIFLILFVNIYLAFESSWKSVYLVFLYLQILFYILVFTGFILQSRKTKLKIIFAPYYIFIMNLSEVIGFIRYIRKTQGVNWEKAKRK
jgi:hypothetical protein